MDNKAINDQLQEQQYTFQMKVYLIYLVLFLGSNKFRL